MLSIQQRFRGGPVLPERFGRQVTVAHAVILAVITLMAIAAYYSLDRAIQVQHEAATVEGLLGHQQMLSQRIASLTGQLALGNVAVRRDLRDAIDAFESAHAQIVAGQPKGGVPSISADAPLNALYFEGSAPLDTAVSDYVRGARRAAAMSPQDPALAASTTLLFLAAQRPLPDALDKAVRLEQDRADRQLAFLRTLGAVICGAVLAALLAGALIVFRPMARRIVQLMREANELAGVATTDPLTGMLNKRSFQARGAIEIQKARRYQRPLSLLMIDADQLTAIESTYGRDGGDTILKALTSSFFGGTRVSDLVGRVDAEQFAILLPETSCEGAQLLAERLRSKINELSVPIDDKFVSCTISVGVAAAEKDASFLWPTFKRADEALYEAKARGRNRVVVAAAA